jgi:GT2 family glycosyltransferase
LTEPPSPKRLAVVILTWNGKEDTLACLESLASGGYPRDDDSILVVDNGSADGTLEAVAERFPWAVCIQNGDNLGFAGGNNAGMRRALDEGYRHVMLLNNDTEVPEGALGLLVDYLDGNPGTGSVQPLLVLHSDRSRIDSLGQELFSLPGARDRAIGTPVEDAPKEPEPIFGPCAAAAVYRAEALHQVGVLDEEFFVLLEDVDLSFRIQLEGWEAALVPAARVYHKRGISSQGKLSGEKKYLLHRNILALAWRYWPARYLLLYLPFLAKGWLWGAWTALHTGRWKPWAALMRGSRELRRRHRQNPNWKAIHRLWMKPLGFGYYWRKVRERITGEPAIP